jgi:anti-anti-sigma factor
MPIPHDVLIFLCYASEDRERVSQLYDDLVVEGFSPWMHCRDLLPGEIWEERIRKVINEADFFLACLSRNAIDTRGSLQAEIKHALRLWEEKREGDIYLIPVKLEDCQLPESLSNFHFAALFENDGFPRLIRAIQKGIQGKSTIYDIVERQAQGDPLSPGYLSKQQPSFQASLSILDQYKLESDYLPLLTKSLIEEFNWNEKIVYRILFIIRELTVNAFEYGCKGDINRNVDISIRMEMIGLSSERIVINIKSPGDGFDISKYIKDQESRRIDDVSGLGLINSKRASHEFTYSNDGKIIQSVIIKNYDRNIFKEFVPIVTYTESEIDGIPIILLSPSGRIDHTSAKAFENAIVPLVDGLYNKQAACGIIVDLKDVPYMSSAGLRVLTVMAKTCRLRKVGKERGDLGVPIVLTNLQPLLQELFRISRFDTIFFLCSSIEESKSHIRDYFMDK